jgi:hypothetical protein
MRTPVPISDRITHLKWPIISSFYSLEGFSLIFLIILGINKEKANRATEKMTFKERSSPQFPLLQIASHMRECNNVDDQNAW